MLKITKYQMIAKKRGGKCLSENYIDHQTKLKWECVDGHIWKATPNSIKQGSWCPVCARERHKLTIEEMQKIAEEKGGKCLSEKYVNVHTKLKWQCKEGHIWEAIPSNIKKGHWCPHCYGTAILTIKAMQKLAKEKGGKCLSEKYKNAHTKLVWQCERGHIWKSRPLQLKRGQWCPYCSGIAKLTIEEMQKIAKEKGGKCLSEKYINAKTKLLWECKEGHIWKATPSNIKKGRWCPICANKNSKLTIELMQDLAKERGGKCLSPNYYNNNTKLIWQCERGHIWKARPRLINAGSWCPKCKYENLKLGIKEMQQIAEERGGKCLSKKYINNYSKLFWQCKEGHIWEAIPNAIKQGSWCPECAIENQKSTIEDMQDLAKEHNGKCLSKTYTNTNTKLKWQCKEGHIWKAIPSNIKQGRWCPECKYENLKLGIKEMQQIAEERGGKCLSKKYVNVQTKLRWQCKEGHIWKTTPFTIKQGKWCPICSSGISERICRTFFREIFQKGFPKKRPKWLVNEKGNRMELDGFNKELKLAFEYNGIQHYKYIPHWHLSHMDFLQRKKDDVEKIRLCKEHHIVLIIVPYTVDYEEMQNYIIRECILNDVSLPKQISHIDYNKFRWYKKNETTTLENWL